MKIGNNVESIQSELVSRAVNGSRTPSSSNREVGAVEGADKVALSSTSRSLAGGAAGDREESLRLEKVAEVRRAIQEGRFHVSAEIVADKMITEAAELVEAIASGRGV